MSHLVRYYTKGKTCPGRLNGVDSYLVTNYSKQLEGSVKFVDIGVGQIPYTTVQAHKSFQKANPIIQTVGIECFFEFVINAEQFLRASPELTSIQIIKGSFSSIPKDAGVIRMFNLFRQDYTKEHITQVYTTLAKKSHNAILVEGTSSPTGNVWVANIYHFTPIPK